jgi:26S proteasome regulatory subunit T5
MYGPPGTGKSLLARACAAQTDATFLKLAGPQLVQMFIGDGAKLVRDCFALAKEKAPAIIFIDELDAVGTKRFDSEKSGDREVQRTMLELLNQLDGFASDDRIKVLAATNRVDVLDPALLRSGRLDRKIEFPLPNEEARAQILKIHSRKMKVDASINWGELARSTDEFGGAQLKAVCVEAGMIALRVGKNKISHEHYVDAIAEVQSKKKEVSSLQYPPHFRNSQLILLADGQLLRLIGDRWRISVRSTGVEKADGDGIDIATIDEETLVIVCNSHDAISRQMSTPEWSSLHSYIMH